MNVSTEGAAQLGEWLAAASRFLAAGSTQEAAALIEAALAVCPSDPDVLNAYGSLLLLRGDLPRATDVLGAAATAYPTHASLCANLGAAYQMAGRHMEARHCWQRAVVLAPDAQSPLLALARGRLLAGDPDEAGEAAAAALARNPDNAEATELIGLVALTRGDHSEAERRFREALERGAGDSALLRGLSICCLHRGATGEALALAERAWLADPLDRDGLDHLARCQAEAGRLADAEATCAKLLAFAPNHVSARALLARIRLVRGEPEAALADLAAFAKANPGSAAALSALADTARESGRLAEAEALCREILRREPDHAPALKLSEDIALAQGRFPPRSGSAVPIGVRIDVPPDMLAGEFILLSRFLPALADEDGRVKLHAREHFLPLAAHLPVGFEEGPPQPDEATLPLPGMLRCFDLDRDWLADPRPYLTADAALAARWRHALQEHPRPWIGFTWSLDAQGLAMEDVRAAIPPGATPVSLMMGEGRHALARWPEALDAGLRLEGFADMIAAVACLDYIIGPDTAATHLAGAVGRPGMAAVGAHQPWHWASRGERALWYPTLRVARQTRPGDWSAVVAALRGACASIVADFGDPAGLQPEIASF
ncbi:tetratricopeptide repeat protein [Methylobacterium komagatae]